MQGVLVIAYPDGRAASLRIHENQRVQNAVMFAAIWPAAALMVQDHPNA
jgi:hypothetical protein